MSHTTESPTGAGEPKRPHGNTGKIRSAETREKLRIAQTAYRGTPEGRVATAEAAFAGGNARRVIWTPDMVAAAYDLRAKGVPGRVVAKKIGVGELTFWRWWGAQQAAGCVSK